MDQADGNIFVRGNSGEFLYVQPYGLVLKTCLRFYGWISLFHLLRSRLMAHLVYIEVQV